MLATTLVLLIVFVLPPLLSQANAHPHTNLPMHQGRLHCRKQLLCTRLRKGSPASFRWWACLPKDSWNEDSKGFLVPFGI